MAPRLIRLFKLCSSQQYKSYSSERLAVIVHYVHPMYFCNFNKRELLLLFCKSWIYKYYFTWITGPPFLKIWDFAHVWYSICTFSCTPTLSLACSLHARWHALNLSLQLSLGTDVKAMNWLWQLHADTVTRSTSELCRTEVSLVLLPFCS